MQPPPPITPKPLEERLEYAKAFVRRGLATFDDGDKELQLDEAKKTFKNFPYGTEDFFVTKEEAEKDPALNAKYLVLILDAKDITEVERKNLIRVASYVMSGQLAKAGSPTRTIPPSPVVPPGSPTTPAFKEAPALETSNINNLIENHFNDKNYLPRPTKKSEDEDSFYQRIAGSPSNTISIGTYAYKGGFKITIKFGIDNKIYIIKHKEGSEYEALVLENPDQAIEFLNNALIKKLKLRHPEERINPIIMWYGSKKLTRICDMVDSIKTEQWDKRVERGEIVYLAPDDKENNYYVGAQIYAPDKKADFAQLIYEAILSEEVTVEGKPTIQGRDFKDIAGDKSLSALGKISYKPAQSDFKQMMAGKGLQSSEITPVKPETIPPPPEFTNMTSSLFPEITASDIDGVLKTIVGDKDDAKINKNELKNKIDQQIKKDGISSKQVVILKMLQEFVDKDQSPNDTSFSKNWLKGKIKEINGPVIGKAFKISLPNSKISGEYARVQLVYYQGSYHILFTSEDNGKHSFFVFSIPQASLDENLKKIIDTKKDSWKVPDKLDSPSESDMEKISQLAFANFRFFSKPQDVKKNKDAGFIEITDIKGLTIGVRKLNDTTLIKVYPTNKDGWYSSLQNFESIVTPYYYSETRKEGAFISEHRKAFEDKLVSVDVNAGDKSISEIEEDPALKAPMPAKNFLDSLRVKLTQAGPDYAAGLNYDLSIDKVLEEVECSFVKFCRANPVGTKPFPRYRDKDHSSDPKSQFIHLSTGRFKRGNKTEYIKVYVRRRLQGDDSYGYREFVILCWTEDSKPEDVKFHRIHIDKVQDLVNANQSIFPTHKELPKGYSKGDFAQEGIFDELQPSRKVVKDEDRYIRSLRAKDAIEFFAYLLPDIEKAESVLLKDVMDVTVKRISEVATGIEQLKSKSK